MAARASGSKIANNFEEGGETTSWQQAYCSLVWDVLNCRVPLELFALTEPDQVSSKTLEMLFPVGCLPQKILRCCSCQLSVVLYLYILLVLTRYLPWIDVGSTGCLVMIAAANRNPELRAAVDLLALKDIAPHMATILHYRFLLVKPHFTFEIFWHVLKPSASARPLCALPTRKQLRLLRRRAMPGRRGVFLHLGACCCFRIGDAYYLLHL